MDDGSISYASHADIHVLRFVGDIRYPLAPSVAQFTDHLLKKIPQATLVIDLTDTRSIDSTNLGLLARIANRVKENKGPRVTIVSTQEDVNALLVSMGFQEVFDIVEANGRTVDHELRTLSPEPTDKDSVARTVLEAHRSLMELNDRNRATFRDVVEALEAADPIDSSAS